MSQAQKQEGVTVQVNELVVNLINTQKDCIDALKLNFQLMNNELARLKQQVESTKTSDMNKLD